MLFAVSSVLTMLLFTTIISGLIFLFTRRNSHFGIYSLPVVLICILFVVLRSLVPFEFRGTESLYLKGFLPGLGDFYNYKLLPYGQSFIRVYHLLFLIWILGSTIFALGFYKKCKNFYKAIDNLPLMDNPQVYEILNKVTTEYGCQTKFLLAKSPEILSPFITGFRNPTIVLSALEISDDTLIHIFRHEVAHYVRRHILIKMFLEALCIVYWWNPVLRLLKGQTIRLLEVEADMFAAKKMDEKERLSYAESLLIVAKSCMLASTDVSAIPCSFSYTSALEQRCNTLLQFRRSKWRNLKEGIKVAGIILVTLSVTVISFTYVFEPYYDFPLDLEGSFTTTKENSFLVINQDDGYDLYFDNEYLITFLEFDESFEHLNVYESLEEVYQYEKR